MTTKNTARFRPRATIVMVAAAVGLWLLAQFGYLPEGVFEPEPVDSPVRMDGADPSWPLSSNTLTVLKNTGFTVGYDNRTQSAAWVHYVARPPGNTHLPARPDFMPDPRVPGSINPRDLPRGYDRGHLAPNYLITKLYGPEAQRQSFYMSNISPQKPRLNQLLWQRLEEIEADHVVRRAGALEVTVGPVFERGREIPAGYYRLWYKPDLEQPQVMAFYVPQDVRGDEALTDFITTVDDIERRTGLDFYASLPDNVEDVMEGRRSAPGHWQFDRKACDTARYNEDWQGRDGIRLRYDRCGVE